MRGFDPVVCSGIGRGDADGFAPNQQPGLLDGEFRGEELQIASVGLGGIDVFEAFNACFQ